MKSIVEQYSSSDEKHETCHLSDSSNELPAETNRHGVVNNRKNGEHLISNDKKKVPNSDGINNQRLLSIIEELKIKREDLDNETWRLNSMTTSNTSVWNKIIQRLQMKSSEKLRHRLYSLWRRNRDKFEVESELDTKVEIDFINMLRKKEKEEFSVSNTDSSSESSDESSLCRQGRAAVTDKRNIDVVNETCFILSYKEWRAVYDSSKRKMQSEWTDLFYHRICGCNFRCVLRFETYHIKVQDSRKKNSPFFNCSATCTIQFCTMRFNIQLRNEPSGKDSLMFHVRVIGKEDHRFDGEGKLRQLTGNNRLIVGKKANDLGALKVFHENIEKSDNEMLEARNFTGCESIDVLKQAAADYRKNFRLDEDIFRECRVRQQILEDIDVKSTKIKGYVHNMAEKPFRLHLNTEDQLLRLIRYCQTSTYSHVHIDATGSIVRQLHNQSAALVYAIVFKDGNDPTNVVPVAHAILTDQTTTSISFFLSTLRQQIVSIKGKVIRPSFFVTDFSPAIFNAVLLTFNHEDIHGHLKRCWNVIAKKYDADQLRAMSFVRICCSHVMNAFAKSLSAEGIRKETRRKILHVFALFINCGEIELSYRFLQRILYMFGDPKAKNTEDVLDRFLSSDYNHRDESDNIGSCEIDVEENEKDPLDQIDEHVPTNNAIIHESPFNIEATRRFPQLLKLLDKKVTYENVKNPLFSRKIIRVFYKWFAYLPLWTSLITRFEERYAKNLKNVDAREYSHGRLSNAQVESYFDILKYSILEKKTNMRPADVILQLYRSTQSQLKADKFGVAEYAKNRKQKAKDLNIEEKWNKKNRKKSRTTYFDMIERIENKIKKDNTDKKLRKDELNNKTNIIQIPDQQQTAPLLTRPTSPKHSTTSNVVANSSIDEIAKENKDIDPSIKKADIRRSKRISRKPKRYIVTPDCSPTRHKRPHVEIDGALIYWPNFEIKNKTFQGNHYTVTNTCGIDSILFILYITYLTEPMFRSVIDDSDIEPYQTLRETFSLVESDGWDEARLHWLIKQNLFDRYKTTTLDMFGSVDSRILRYLKYMIQHYRFRSICDRPECPKRERITTSVDIALQHWETFSSDFEYGTTSKCSFIIGSQTNISHQEGKKHGYLPHLRRTINTTTNEDEEEDVWLCNGTVISEPWEFESNPPPIIFIDIIHPHNEQGPRPLITIHDLQLNITLRSSRYQLKGTINHANAHFTAAFFDKNHQLYLFDDLKGLRQIEYTTLMAETAIYLLQQ